MLGWLADHNDRSGELQSDVAETLYLASSCKACVYSNVRSSRLRPVERTVGDNSPAYPLRTDDPSLAISRTSRPRSPPSPARSTTSARTRPLPLSERSNRAIRRRIWRTSSGSAFFSTIRAMSTAPSALRRQRLKRTSSRGGGRPHPSPPGSPISAPRSPLEQVELSSSQRGTRRERIAGLLAESVHELQLGRVRGEGSIRVVQQTDDQVDNL